MADDDLSSLADPSRAERLFKASGTKEEQQPFMVAVDASGKAVRAWKGSKRRTSFDPTVTQYAITTNTLAAARKHGEILHRQRGRTPPEGT